MCRSVSKQKLCQGVGHVNIITSKKLLKIVCVGQSPKDALQKMRATMIKATPVQQTKWLKIVCVGQSPKDALQKMRATMIKQHPFNRP